MPKFPFLSVLFATCVGLAGIQAAQAQTATPTQDPAVVAAEVEAYLHAQASSYPGAAQITVETPRITNQPACDQLQTFLPSGQRLRARMTVGVRCTAPQSWTSYVQANLSIQGYYYVANRMIQVGDSLAMDDMSAREGDILRMANGVIFDPSQAIGYIASQRISVGSPIKSRALRDPNSIQRGQTVRTEARGTGFVATGEGQALQSGAPGAQIQVRASSGQIVSGTVLDAHTVLVLM